MMQLPFFLSENIQDVTFSSSWMPLISLARAFFWDGAMPRRSASSSLASLECQLHIFYLHIVRQDYVDFTDKIVAIAYSL